MALGFTLSGHSADWPAYRGLSHNGESPEVLGQNPEPKENWEAAMNGGFSSLVVGDDKIYTLELSQEGNSRDEVCRALDRRTGKTVWSQALGKASYDGGGDSGASDNKGGDGPRSTPSYYQKGVITLSSQMVLSRHHSDTRELVWQHLLQKTNGVNLPKWQNAASPLVVDGRIFVCGGGENQAFLCFDALTGATIWKTGTDDMTHTTPVQATIDEVHQIIFFTRSGLVSLSPESGQTLWKQEFPFNVSTAASPVVDGNIVYCSAGYGVGAAAYKVTLSGEEWTIENLWRKRNQLMNHWSTPVARDGYLYGMFSFKKYGTGPLMCVRLSDGEEIWSQEGFGPGNVILTADHLIALGDAGQLVLVNPTPEKYAESYRFDHLTGKCWSTPALSNGVIYIRSTDQAKAITISATSVAAK